MYKPSAVSASPDHYVDGQIKDNFEASVPLNWIGKNNVTSNKVIWYDQIDESFLINVRITPNENYIWEESDLTQTSVPTVYQVDGTAGTVSQFNLKKITEEYCNPPTSVYSYYQSTNIPFQYDETLIREQSNIYHYDVFEGVKKTAWPNFSDYSGAYPTGISSWSEAYTNVDYIHQPSFYNYNYYNYYYMNGYNLLFDSSITGTMPTILEDYLQPCSLDPSIPSYFPSGSIIPEWPQQGGGFNNTSYSGYKICGASFNGNNLILRVHSFSQTALIGSEGVINIPVTLSSIKIPSNYSYWPWLNDNDNFYIYDNKILFPSMYDIASGQNIYYGSYYPFLPEKKACICFTQKNPLVESTSGFNTFTYKNVVIYDRTSRSQAIMVEDLPRSPYFSGKNLVWFAGAVCVDIQISFKKKNFPEISSIPNISIPRTFAVVPEDIRPLSYRDVYKLDSGWYAYKSLTNEEARVLVDHYQTEYGSSTTLKYSSNGYAVSNSNYNYLYNQNTFVVYEPNYPALKQPVFQTFGDLESGFIKNKSDDYYYYYYYNSTRDINNIPDPFNLYYYYNFYYYDQKSFINSGTIPFASNESVTGNLNFTMLNIYNANYDYYYYYNMVKLGTSLSMTVNIPQITVDPTKYYQMYVNTLGISPTQEYVGVELIPPRFGEKGFGDGWFGLAINQLSIPNPSNGRLTQFAGSFYVADPNGNILRYYNPNTDYITPTTVFDGNMEASFLGNYYTSSYTSIPTGGYAYKYWFYNGNSTVNALDYVLNTSNPSRGIKPFGTYYQGSPNNEGGYCEDGIYLVIGQSYIDQIQPLPGYYNNTNQAAPRAMYPIGAFYIETTDNQFLIYDVPLYYVPDLDLTKPYYGCLNASYQILITSVPNTLNSSNIFNYNSSYAGKPKIVVSSQYVDNYESLIEIYGPDTTQLVLDEDYEVLPYSSQRPGCYVISFLKTLGNLFENEYTDNPPSLADGNYKIILPTITNKTMSSLSYVDNMTSVSNTGYNYSVYYNYYFFSEFYIMNFNSFYNNGFNPYYYNYVDQFMPRARTNDPQYFGYNARFSDSEVISLSPIRFRIKNCIFTGTNTDDPDNPYEIGFKCDFTFTEYLEEDELPANPNSYNQLLEGIDFVEADTDY
jgi:hypothetical protein